MWNCLESQQFTGALHPGNRIPSLLGGDSLLTQFVLYRWDDSNLRRTLLMLEEQKRWLEEYRQTISPQKPVLSMSSGPEGRTPKFTYAYFFLKNFQSSDDSVFVAGLSLATILSLLQLQVFELAMHPDIGLLG